MSIKHSLLILFLCVSLIPNSQAVDAITFLEDTREFAFDGVQTEVYGLTYSRKLEVRINLKEGTELFQNFKLPEPFDEVHNDICAESRYTDFYLNIKKPKNISIEIVRDGKRKSIDSKNPVISTTRVLNYDQNLYGDAYNFNYQIPDLKVDDVVKIEYEIYIPFNENRHELSWLRIFFHRKFPVKQSRVEINWVDGSPINFEYFNEAYPHQHFRRNKLFDKWEYNDLAPALNEPKSHPHEELPHVIIQIKKEPSVGNIRVPDEFYARLPVYNFLRKLHNDALAQKVGSTNLQQKHLRDFISMQLPDDRTDTTDLADLKHIFNQIATDFTYEADSEYYSGEQLFEPKFATQLLEKKIRETDKQLAYANILLKLEQPFFLVHIADKRTTVLSEGYLKPLYNTDLIFGPILKTGQIVYLYPKRSKSGLLLDELPFYFEGTNAVLMTFQLSAKPLSETFIYPSKVFSQTPESKASDNVRNVAVSINVIDGKNALCEQKIRLNGQFSTLMRGKYLKNENFPYVDEEYNQIIWENLNYSKLTYSAEIENTSFPFNTIINADYVLDIQQSIPIGDFIRHIVPILHEENPRTLSYHADFLCHDRIFVNINTPDNFNADIPQRIHISNGFAEYHFDISKHDSAGGYQMLSELKIKRAKVESAHFNEVVEIYDAIKKAMTFQLVSQN